MKNSQYKDKQELKKVNQSKQLKFTKLDTTELKSLATGCSPGYRNIYDLVIT